MTTPCTYIAHVNEAIAKALRGESYLDASVLDIKGFSTTTQRLLVNNLAHLPKENPCYLEVGLYAGATFAAACGIPNLTAIGIENFSQPFGDETIKDQLYRNLSPYLLTSRIFLLGKDWQDVTMEYFPGLPIDLYYYDGAHDEPSQAKALPHFIDAMADTFIYMVDDYAWEPVHAGTRAGFDALAGRIKIEQEWILTEGVPDGKTWHNDVYLAVISRL